MIKPCPPLVFDELLAKACARRLKARSLKLRATWSGGEGISLPLHRVRPKHPRLSELVRQLELVRRDEREGFQTNAAIHLELALQELLEHVDTRNPFTLWRRAAELRDFLTARF